MEKYPKQLEHLDNSKQVFYFPNNYTVVFTGIVIGRMFVKLKVKRKGKLYTVHNHGLFDTKDKYIVKSKKEANSFLKEVALWEKVES